MEAYHYPPHIFQILVDLIPRVCRSKKDVLQYFRNAGVPPTKYRDLTIRVETDPSSITKFTIVREILTRLNEDASDDALRQRRELLKRTVEIEDLSICWPNDQLPAKGLLAELRDAVNVKDSFTRMRQEKEKQETVVREARLKAAREKEEKRRKLDSIKHRLFALFGESDAPVRGKSLEAILNELFRVYDISVREAFTRRGEEGEGIVEQIDGVIELNGELYLVEVKWLNKNVGKQEFAQHFVQVFTRANCRGIMISAMSFSDAAIADCRAALAQKTIVLCELEEIVRWLDSEVPLRELFKRKVTAAEIDREPLVRPPPA